MASKSRAKKAPKRAKPAPVPLESAAHILAAPTAAEAHAQARLARRRGDDEGSRWFLDRAHELERSEAAARG